MLELRNREDVVAHLVRNSIEVGDRLERRAGRPQQQVRVLRGQVEQVEEEHFAVRLGHPLRLGELEGGGEVEEDVQLRVVQLCG